MNIQNYTAFVKAVEYGSFTKAADALNYRQSGISRMMNDLESEWRVSFEKRAFQYQFNIRWFKITAPAQT
ncbi:LysR family transcriptional regulator [Aquibacillus sp. 3ASR75-11]|uniref:LysR family transcriptional regulator n=1 Tax=Terrihalobacillus insolitus TaxID=2950438 RepID=A0A9X3WUP9_9BACI|nr:LysR family transcriptional regulator [Terrihalobacillus insolitus]MDC3424581.1 LysR family transcriptional regulator [Terrihalobacillus insolitus]